MTITVTPLPAIVEHEVPLNGYTGRQTVLARWNVGDTIMAFYSCVDLDIEDRQNVCITVLVILPQRLLIY